jgi:hypothetical protein
MNIQPIVFAISQRENSDGSFTVRLDAVRKGAPTYDELLAGLKEVLERIDPQEPDDSVKAARALIARAEG